jgi:hypothetical protein
LSWSERPSLVRRDLCGAEAAQDLRRVIAYVGSGVLGGDPHRVRDGDIRVGLDELLEEA